MGFIHPDFILNVSTPPADSPMASDQYVSLTYDVHKKTEQGQMRTIETNEVNHFMQIPYIDGSTTFSNIEEVKFNKDRLVLATIHEKDVISKVLYINEKGEMVLEDYKK